MVQIKQSKSATKPTKRTRSKKPGTPVAPTTPPTTPPPTPTLTKRDRLQARLEEAGGASLAQLVTAFGWQPHTVRAAISGLRKAGLEVQRETVDDASVYRIVASKAA